MRFETKGARLKAYSSAFSWISSSSSALKPLVSCRGMSLQRSKMSVS